MSTASPTPQDRTRRARGSLSADVILDAAEQIVDHDGLHGLSMPILARALGSGVTSIYWYFRSKDDLVVALADRVEQRLFARLPPVGDGPWDDELVAYFSAYRELIHRTPVYRETFSFRLRAAFSGSAITRSVLRRIDAGLALFVQAGLTADEAARAYQSCASYTNGFVALEHGRALEDAGTDADIAAAADASLARLDPREVPVLSQVSEFGTVVAEGDAQFRRGLRLLLAGVARAIDQDERALLN